MMDGVKTQVVVKSDYGGYFEQLVRSWLEKKGGPSRHDVIEVSAGPYRASAVTYKTDGRTLKLDFYSALRTGFGSLSTQDVADLTSLL